MFVKNTVSLPAFIAELLNIASKAIGWGYNLTTIGGDTRLLASAAAASVSSWRKLTGRKEKAQVTGGVY